MDTCSASPRCDDYAPRPIRPVDRYRETWYRRYSLAPWSPRQYRPSAREPRAASLIVSVVGRTIRLAVNPQAQLFSYLEKWHSFGGHRYQCAAFGIAPLSGPPVL